MSCDSCKKYFKNKFGKRLFIVVTALSLTYQTAARHNKQTKNKYHGTD